MSSPIFPKHWGTSRSEEGEGQARAHQNVGLPYQTTIGNGYETRTSNGFIDIYSSSVAKHGLYVSLSGLSDPPMPTRASVGFINSADGKESDSNAPSVDRTLRTATTLRGIFRDPQKTVTSRRADDLRRGPLGSLLMVQGYTTTEPVPETVYTMSLMQTKDAKTFNKVFDFDTTNRSSDFNARQKGMYSVPPASIYLDDNDREVTSIGVAHRAVDVSGGVARYTSKSSDDDEPVTVPLASNAGTYAPRVWRVAPRALIAYTGDQPMSDPEARALENFQLSKDNGKTWQPITGMSGWQDALIYSMSGTATWTGPPTIGEQSVPLIPSAIGRGIGGGMTGEGIFVLPETAESCLFIVDLTSYCGRDLIWDMDHAAFAFRGPTPPSVWRISLNTGDASMVRTYGEPASYPTPAALDEQFYQVINAVKGIDPGTNDEGVDIAVTLIELNWMPVPMTRNSVGAFSGVLNWQASGVIYRTFAYSGSGTSWFQPLAALFYETDLEQPAKYPGEIKIRAIFDSGKQKFLIYNEDGDRFYRTSPQSGIDAPFGRQTFPAGYDQSYQAQWLTEDFLTFTRLPDIPVTKRMTGKRRWLSDTRVVLPMYQGGKYKLMQSDDHGRTWSLRAVIANNVPQPRTSHPDDSSGWSYAQSLYRFNTVESVRDDKGNEAPANPYSGAWVCDERIDPPSL